MNALRSLAFHAIFQSGSVLYVLAALISLAVAPRHLLGIANGWSRFHRRCVTRIMGIAVREIGERAQGMALYAIKHESFFEAIDVPVMLDNPVPFAKQELFEIPGWGRAARAYGVVPVMRAEGARALRSMIREARRYIGSGRPLVIFPEGTRVPHGQIAPLQAGFAALYKALSLPVVPVAVDSGLTYTGFWKRRGTITLRFGPPIAPGLPRAELEAQVLRAINALNEVQAPAG